MPAKRITVLPTCGEGQGGDDRCHPLLNREDSGHRVECDHVGQQPIDLELASQELGGDPPPDLVVVNRHAKEADLEVAQAHNRLRISAYRQPPSRFETVMDGQPPAFEIKRYPFVDVRDPDADLSYQRGEVSLLLGTALDVGLDPTPPPRRARAG